MNHIKISKIPLVLFAIVLCFGPVGLAGQAGTAFTYQGRLLDANQTADGLYDFQFKLFDANSGGNKFGPDINEPNVDVIDGYFTVGMDFGNVFDGNERWLEIGVRQGNLNDPNIYTSLSPRQKVTATPYAIYALGGGGGGSLWQVNGSDIYYNNGNVGIGTASPSKKLDVGGGINSTDYYYLNNHVLAYNPSGTGDFYYGWDIAVTKHVMATNGIERLVIDGAGEVGIGTTSPAAKLDVSGDISVSSNYKIGGSTVLSVAGSQNTLVGIGAGAVNTGFYNTFSGYRAGYLNTTGISNTFSGESAGYNNTTGGRNTFSGDVAGYSNTTASDNTFSGYYAGSSNTTGNHNTFSGSEAGYSNDTGSNNTFSGYYTGISNTNGSGNMFSGCQAGYSNTSGNDNTFSGYNAGYKNTTGIYNTFSGESAGYNNTTGSNNTFSGDAVGYSNTTGSDNTFSGYYAGILNTTGSHNTFSGSRAGYSNTTGNGNVFIGYQAGYNETGSNKLYIANGWSDANVLMYGDFSSKLLGIGLVNPSEALDVNGTARLRGIAAGSGTTVVVDGNGKLWKSSSSRRYKTNIETLDTGMDTVLKLRPVRFEYKETGQKDIGLIAEDVEKISKDLVIYDNEGRPDAVKYDKVALYLLSVVKSQQEEIAALKKNISQNQLLEQRVKTMESVLAKLSQQEGGIK